MLQIVMVVAAPRSAYDVASVDLYMKGDVRMRNER